MRHHGSGSAGVSPAVARASCPRRSNVEERSPRSVNQKSDALPGCTSTGVDARAHIEPCRGPTPEVLLEKGREEALYLADNSLARLVRRFGNSEYWRGRGRARHGQSSGPEVGCRCRGRIAGPEDEWGIDLRVRHVGRRCWKVLRARRSDGQCDLGRRFLLRGHARS